MANPTLADLRARVRLNARDNSATAANQALTDANIDGWINIGMRMVQRRYAPRMVGQSATATGLSFATGIVSGMTILANYARLVTVMRAATSFIYGPPLVWKDIGEFQNLRGGQSKTNLVSGAGTTDARYPSYWTGWRGGTVTVADQGKWTVLIHPTPDSAAVVTLSAIVELEQADLASGADSPDVPAEGCSLIECIASFFAAHNLGRPWANTFMEAYPELKDEVAWKVRDEARVQGTRAAGRA